MTNLTLPGLEGAPRTGKRRGQDEDEKDRKVRQIYRLKEERSKKRQDSPLRRRERRGKRKAVVKDKRKKEKQEKKRGGFHTETQRSPRKRNLKK